MVASFCGENVHNLKICDKFVRSRLHTFPEIKAPLELTLKLTTVTYYIGHFLPVPGLKTAG